MTTTTNEDMSQFRVIRENYSIIPRDPDNPFRPPVSGTLAWCPSRRAHIGRQDLVGASGTKYYAYWAVPDDRDDPPTPLNGSGDETDSILARMEQARLAPRWAMVPIDDTHEVKEAKEFARTWPHVAARLGLTAPPPDQVFPTGPAYRPAVLDQGLAGTDWRRLVARHASGDHGLFGRHDPGPSAYPEVAFLIGLQSLSVRNAYAAVHHANVVRSAYEVPGRDDVVVHVATAFAGLETITLVIPAAREVRI